MKLFLEDNTAFQGERFGAHVSASGEVVFNTGMVGYVESLTDPSYSGQILVCTYPLVGNYGVPKKELFESSKIQVAGLIVSEYSEQYSHSAAQESLGAWLTRSGIPALSGIDTRALTKRLREHGVLLGAIADKKPKTIPDPTIENLVARVSTKKRVVYGSGKKKVVLLDCGAKENIVRSLVARGVTVIRVPWDYDFTRERCDGVLISNGPGDPTSVPATVAHIQKAMQKNMPILGICLGNQLLALAAGASTYKLKYGHRSHNQPCIEAKTKRCHITSQNHGFAVDDATLPRDWTPWFTNANDNSNEGIQHSSKRWRSVQFHPEAAPGPTDTAWIFDDFIRSL